MFAAHREIDVPTRQCPTPNARARLTPVFAVRLEAGGAANAPFERQLS